MPNLVFLICAGSVQTIKNIVQITQTQAQQYLRKILIVCFIICEYLLEACVPMIIQKYNS